SRSPFSAMMTNRCSSFENFASRVISTCMAPGFYNWPTSCTGVPRMAYRVLVVDDETAIREAIRMTLEYEGYKIDEARSGQEGIDKSTKTPYDAILLDIKMPVLDGIEVLENLKEQRVAAPVIMVSGHGDISTAVECT